MPSTSVGATVLIVYPAPKVAFHRFIFLLIAFPSLARIIPYNLCVGVCLMKTYKIESKINVKPNKSDKVEYVLVYVLIVCVVLYNMGDMLENGISFGSIFGCIVALVVGYLLRGSRKTDAPEEVCMLLAQFQDDCLTVKYPLDHQRKIIIPFDRITSLEYSRKVGCLRMMCRYEEHICSKIKKHDHAELLLNIHYASNLDFYLTLQKHVAPELKWVDEL